MSSQCRRFKVDFLILQGLITGGQDPELLVEMHSAKLAKFQHCKGDQLKAPSHCNFVQAPTFSAEFGHPCINEGIAPNQHKADSKAQLETIIRGTGNMASTKHRNVLSLAGLLILKVHKQKQKQISPESRMTGFKDSIALRISFASPRSPGDTNWETNLHKRMMSNEQP